MEVKNVADPRYPLLEGCRGLACLMVVFYHCGLNLRVAPYALWGFTGVHLFFVLSGFLLYRPFIPAMAGWGAFPMTGDFYARRFLRIYPPYVISLSVFLLLRYLLGQQMPSALELIARITLTFNYKSDVNFFGVNSVYWSLAIEAQFYLVLPLMCRAAAKCTGRQSPWLLPAILIAAGVGARCAEHVLLAGLYVGNVDHVTFRSLLSYLDLFAFGMLAAGAERTGWGIRFSSWPMVAVGSILFWFGNYWCAVATDGRWQTGSMPLVYVAMFPVVICVGLGILMLGASSRSSPAFVWLGWWPLRFAGEVSYSLYLYHTGVQFFLFKFSPFKHLPFEQMALIHGLISIPLCGGVAVIMYRTVERPSLSLVRRFRRPTLEPMVRSHAAHNKVAATTAPLPA
ncbi:MAG: Acyltransferase 3 [Glaciihabitans sp.]|nr:Acyltransferase 3 [Glaciihabitans sp.]